MDGDEQSRVVAHYLCHQQAQAVVAKDQERKARRRPKVGDPARVGR